MDEFDESDEWRAADERRAALHEAVDAWWRRLYAAGDKLHSATLAGDNIADLDDLVEAVDSVLQDWPSVRDACRTQWSPRTPPEVPTSGWGDLRPGERRVHYFRADNEGRSSCGRVGLYQGPRYRMPVAGQACAACLRKEAGR